jgi:hypothetical protein
MTPDKAEPDSKQPAGKHFGKRVLAVLAAVLLLVPLYIGAILLSIFHADFLMAAGWTVFIVTIMVGVLRWGFSRSRKPKGPVGLSVAFLGLAIIFARTFDFPPLGTVPDASWIERLHISPDESRSYIVSDFIDEEIVWRTRLPEEKIALIAQEFRMERVSPDSLPGKFFQMPPYWWWPRVTEHSTAWLTPGFPESDRGPDGKYGVAIWDADNQVLYMWLKSNF